MSSATNYRRVSAAAVAASNHSIFDQQLSQCETSQTSHPITSVSFDLPPQESQHDISSQQQHQDEDINYSVPLLWELIENQSTAQVQLLLPDLTHKRPYYLPTPRKSAANRKLTADGEEELDEASLREQRRLEFLTARDCRSMVRGCLGSSIAGKVSDSTAERVQRTLRDISCQVREELSVREKGICEDMLNVYRYDDDRRKSLVRRVHKCKQRAYAERQKVHNKVMEQHLMEMQRLQLGPDESAQRNQPTRPPQSKRISSFNDSPLKRRHSRNKEDFHSIEDTDLMSSTTDLLAFDIEDNTQMVQEISDVPTDLSQSLLLTPPPPQNEPPNCPEKKLNSVSILTANEMEHRRQTLVMARRASISKEQDRLAADLNLVLEQRKEKVQMKLKELTKPIHIQRTLGWMRIFTTLISLTKMQAIVVNARMMKSTSIYWNAAVCIQRTYRKHVKYLTALRNGRDHPSGKLTMNAVASLLRKDPNRRQNRHIYINRRNSCNLIVQFLRDNAGRMNFVVSRFLKCVRQLQRLVRRHLQVNFARFEALRRLIDVCLPTLLMHIELINGSKGLDLQNITNAEVMHLRRMAPTKDCVSYHNQSNGSTFQHQIFAHMNTIGFHSFLRNQAGKLDAVLAVFSDKHPAHRSLRFRTAIGKSKKDVLRDLVVKKRRQFVASLNSLKVMKIQIPPLSEEDIRNFVKGTGVDPLSSFLEAKLKEEQEMVESHLLRQQMRQAPKARTVSDQPHHVTSKANETGVSSFVDVISDGNLKMPSVRKKHSMLTRQSYKNKALVDASNVSTRSEHQWERTPEELHFRMLTAVTVEDIALWCFDVVAQVLDLKAERRALRRSQIQSFELALSEANSRADSMILPIAADADVDSITNSSSFQMISEEPPADRSHDKESTEVVHRKGSVTSFGKISAIQIRTAMKEAVKKVNEL